jgi:hypothetical protein
MLSLYEATTDPVFPPFNFVEFPLEFGRGAYLNHPYDINRNIRHTQAHILTIWITA